MIPRSFHRRWLLPILALALLLRLPGLDRRPMHTDEAVHAVKFGALLEEGFYEYDPFEYHGPTLNYFTLIPAWLGGKRSFASVDEFTLRIVPVFFGMLGILLLAGLREELGRKGLLLAAALLAFSPAMSFYSRYYIQETLLVCFSAGVIVCGFRFWRRPAYRWSALAGLSAGLMLATKETAVIILGAMAVAGWIAIARGGNVGTSFPAAAPARRTRLRHLLTFCLAALAISALFYSSFFAHPRGIVDAFRTFWVYIDRGTGHEWHIHPWYFYLQRMLFWHPAGGYPWNEGVIAGFAALGMIGAFSRRQMAGFRPVFLRFWSIYTLLLLVFFSLLPYKTPWNMLIFLYGMAILAAAGALMLLQHLRHKSLKILIAMLLIGGLGQALWLSYRANFREDASPVNPYVYAHTGEDVPVLVKRIEALARAHPEGKSMFIEVIFPGDDYWPLPWYLRDFSRVGWWRAVDMTVPAAPLILLAPAVEDSLLRKLYAIPPPGQRELYVPLFDRRIELRPGVEMRAYVRKSLWDDYERASGDMSIPF